MSTKRDEELERAFTEGRWVQAIADAERCVEIFDLPEARLRPVAAWNLLPQGFEVSGSRMMLAAVPVEPPDVQALWPFEMAKLRERLASVKSKFELWSTTFETVN